MDKLNIQIQEIENGFIVTIVENKFIKTPNGLQQAQVPIPTYCDGFESVCSHLKSCWPKKVI